MLFSKHSFCISSYHCCIPLKVGVHCEVFQPQHSLTLISIGVYTHRNHCRLLLSFQLSEWSQTNSRDSYRRLVFSCFRKCLDAARKVNIYSLFIANLYNALFFPWDHKRHSNCFIWNCERSENFAAVAMLQVSIIVVVFATTTSAQMMMMPMDCSQAPFGSCSIFSTCLRTIKPEKTVIGVWIEDENFCFVLLFSRYFCRYFNIIHLLACELYIHIDCAV